MNEEDIRRRLLDLVPDVVILYDEEGRYRYANRATAEFLGTDREALIGKTDRELFPGRSADTIQRRLAEALATGEPQQRQYPLEMPSGETRVWNATWTPFSDDDAGFRGVAGIVRDVTERHRARQALARTKKKYEAVFAFNAVSLIVIDVETGRVLEANEGFEQLYGLSREEIEGTHYSDVDHFLDPTFLSRLHQRVLEEGDVRGALTQARRRDGEVRDVLISAVRVSVEDEVYVVATTQDVSPLKSTERELRRRALHDALTGLPNRDLLWDRCEQALERAHRRERAIAVAYLDLDGFKAVNDSAGHGVGDEVLTELAERLSDSVRGEDTVARIGGDEFVVLLTEVGGAREVRTAVERFLGSFAQPISVSDRTFEPYDPRASCGVLLVEPAAITRLVNEADLPAAVDEMIDRADEVMYGVKNEPDEDYRLVSLAE